MLEMATNVTKNQILVLYKALLRESKKIPSYNFRTYALRKIKDSFQENCKLINPKDITSIYFDGVKNLEIIERQVLIGQMYQVDKLVIENIHSN